tara:strand:- start:653 stop:811 length:159 start_codon:yes stop_codon:yes gene_type:complete
MKLSPEEVSVIRGLEEVNIASLSRMPRFLFTSIGLGVTSIGLGVTSKAKLSV